MPEYTVISQNLANDCPDIVAPVVMDGEQDRPTPSVRWVKKGSDLLLEWWCDHRGWVEVPFVPNAYDDALEEPECDHEWAEKSDSSGGVDGGPEDRWEWRECRLCGEQKT